MEIKFFFLVGIAILLIGNISGETISGSNLITLKGKIVDIDSLESVFASIKMDKLIGTNWAEGTIPYYTSGGNFEITGLSSNDIIRLTITSPSYLNEVVSVDLSTTPSNNIYNVGNIKMYPESGIVSSNIPMPDYLNKYEEKVDFEGVFIKITSIDLDNYGNYDNSRIFSTSNTEYYVVPMFQDSDPSLEYLVSVKPGSKVEFWKGGKKISEKTLSYDARKELREGCTYYLFNDDGNKVHFDVCTSVTSPADSTSSNTKNQIVDDSKVYLGGEVLTTASTSPTTPS